MVHPETELRWIGEPIGVALFARKPLARGTLVWVKDDLDQTLTTAAFERLPLAGRDTLLRYTSRYETGELILCWDGARFICHSCSPNTLDTRARFSIAIRDIAAGEQVTEDYAALNLAGDEAFQCACADERCRKFVSAADATTLRGGWDAALREALAVLDKAEQPLWPLMKTEFLFAAKDKLGLAPPR